MKRHPKPHKEIEMFNAYMLTSKVFARVYMAWVTRMEKLAKSGQWSQEWENARKQVQRMQDMYDDLEHGKIVFLWLWHKAAIQAVKDAK